MSTYRISKDFAFSAAHMLSGLPEDHQCSRLHGHNYKVRVVLEGPLVPPGFVRDYGDLSLFRRYLDDNFEHRFLGYGDLYFNQPDTPYTGAAILGVVQFNPTAENLAKYFYDWIKPRFPEVVAVGVSETDKTWAYYDSGEIIETDWRSNE
jgi:6-pyruvoyltetrahydropterin/6-carboxytetrahydropterin synthase